EARRLAVEGARIFSAKGCTRCHTVGEGDRDGPDLTGVTERRSYAWIVMMVTQPEYMVQADHTAQQLLIEHFLEMPDLEITGEEARAGWAYLLAGGRRGGPGGAQRRPGAPPPGPPRGPRPAPRPRP